MRKLVLFLALTLALPAAAGGGGPLEISRVHGDVWINPLAAGAEYLPAGADWSLWRPLAPRHGWRRVRPGSVMGFFLLRTGPNSWVHLDRKRWCVDPGSLVRIESYADFEIKTLRGRVTAADGRPGPRAWRKYDSISGVLRR